MMVESHRVQPSPCPKCGAMNDSVTQITPPFDAKPAEGDATTCIQCGEIAIFDHKLRLREPTKKERKQVERHPFMQKARSFIFQRRN